MNRLDWATVVVFALVLVGVALYHARKLRAQDDVYLAGRSMSRWPIAISMYMALFSTNTLLGSTGWLLRPDGTVWVGLQHVGIIMVVPLVVWLYPALFFRLRIRTAYEYLEQRFDYRVRAFAAVFFLATRIMWMSIMLYSTGLVISMVLGDTAANHDPGLQVRAIILVGILGTSFCFVGGMHAVIWTDVVQFFALLIGIGTMVVLAVGRSGGLGEVFAVAAEAGKFAPPPVVGLTQELTLLSALLMGAVSKLSSTGADQMLLQTYLTARSEHEAKASLWRSGFIIQPISLIYPLLGTIMFVYYQAHPQTAAIMRKPDDALPVFVMHVLPAGIRGLMVVAILSAVLDSLAAGMAATSACVQVDFIGRWRRRPLSDRGAVVLARVLICLWGVAIIAAALAVNRLGDKNNIIQILNIVMYPFAGVLLGVFLLAILVRRAHG
ncbi:MAG: hypothetical protein HRF43_18055, partial [Phycisphaerae bacterium]